MRTHENYKANLVLIKIKACEGWIKLEVSQKNQVIKLMTESADMEDTSAKHPVTPGEIIPARELLGDMYLEVDDFNHAYAAYKADLDRHPNRFNGLYGAGLALEKLGDTKKANQYYERLMAITNSSVSDRPQILAAELFVRNNN